VLTITKKEEAAPIVSASIYGSPVFAYVPQSGDTYTIRIAGELVSSGTVNISGATLTFRPESGGSFTATLTAADGKTTSDGGTITFKNGIRTSDGAVIAVQSATTSTPPFIDNPITVTTVPDSGSGSGGGGGGGGGGGSSTGGSNTGGNTGGQPQTPKTYGITLSGNNNLQTVVGVEVSEEPSGEGEEDVSEEPGGEGEEPAASQPAASLNILSTTAPPPQPVTITNTGDQPTGPLTLTLTGDSDVFTLDPPVRVQSIGVGSTGSFEVGAKSGLPLGYYTATVKVTGGNSISAEFRVTFMVAKSASSFADFISNMGGYKKDDDEAYVLLSNVTENCTAAALNSTAGPATVVIDGGGRNITGDGTDDGITVGAGITLTVTNLRLHSLKFSVDGTLVLGDGVFMDGESGSRVSVRYGGKLEMMDGAEITQGNWGGVALGPWGTGPTSVPPKFTMTGGKISGATAHGGVFMMADYSEFTMSGGEISGNSSNNLGGGVKMQGAGSKFTMTGGTISANSNTSAAGGGVYITGASAEFTMTGGEISNNSAFNGGGVAVWGAGSTFIMENGVISGNNGVSTGGGVLMYGASSEFTMTGGEISGNRAPNGGGVVVPQDTPATFNMIGGIVKNNTATQDGGGVYVLSGAFTMTGGEITGNTAGNRGSGLFLSSVTFTGDPRIGSPVTSGSGQGWIHDNTKPNSTTLDDVYPPLAP
jgi:hypothetical protein